MTNRYGRIDQSVPYCIRQLPENQPRNRQEFMIRKQMNPDDPDMYFDNSGRFLYDTKCMSRELEDMKVSRSHAFHLLQKQAGYLKSLIIQENKKPKADIASMRDRYIKAQFEAANKAKCNKAHIEASNTTRCKTKFEASNKALCSKSPSEASLETRSGNTQLEKPLTSWYSGAQTLETRYGNSQLQNPLTSWYSAAQTEAPLMSRYKKAQLEAPTRVRYNKAVTETSKTWASQLTNMSSSLPDSSLQTQMSPP